MLIHPWHIEMLGGLRACHEAQAITRFKSHKVALLLAYLAFYPTRQHTRDELIALLWPDDDLQAARNRLRVGLSSLRHQLEPLGVPDGSVLIADRLSVRLHPKAFTTDTAQFETAFAAALHADDEAGRTRLLIAAVESYGGDLLPGYYEDWVLSERERLAQSYLQALHRLVRCLANERDYERALAYARRAVQADPVREEAHRDVIRLCVALGQPSAALQQYQELERLLKEALNAAPAPATQQLAEQIATSLGHAAGRASVATSSAAVSAPIVPSPTSAPSAPARPAAAAPGRLPVFLTRFFGREQELATLQALLTPDAPPQNRARLVILTGPGGTGKTRLATELAERLRPAFAENAWFVALADVTDPRRIADAIGSALRLPRSPQAEPLQQVVEALSPQPALLVLDNFEHLVEGGTPLVASLLAQVPTLTCLITSRRSLGPIGGREFPVLPLPVPPVAEALAETRVSPSVLPAMTAPLWECASVQLFVDRAQAALPHFQLTANNAADVAALCQKLEGIPLAIELAAARARVLTAGQMRGHLASRFDLLVDRHADKDRRHRSLWATISWSYHLLAPELRRLLARLSVFHGGWSLDAAQTVCEEPEILEGLEQLRLDSLILAEEAAGEMRFRMLETLREFAQEQLSADERASLARRHARYFLALAEEARPHLKGEEQGRWLDHLEREQENLRAALDWCRDDPDGGEIGLRLTRALWRFWSGRAYLTEAHARYKAALAHPGAQAPTELRASTLMQAGRIALNQDALPEARALSEESLALYRALGDREGQAHVLGTLGNVAMLQGDYAAARALQEESLAIHRERDDREGIAAALSYLGMVAYKQEEYAETRALYTEGLDYYRAAGDRRNVAMILGNLGNVAMRQGDYAAARALQEESLAIHRELGTRSGMAQALYNLATATIHLGNRSAGRAPLIECLRICQELRIPLGVQLVLDAFAGLAYLESDWERAAWLYGISEAQRQSLGVPLPPAELADHEQTYSRLRAELGDSAFDTAFTRGLATPREQAIAAVLAANPHRSLS